MDSPAEILQIKAYLNKLCKDVYFKQKQCKTVD